MECIRVLFLRAKLAGVTHANKMLRQQNASLKTHIKKLNAVCDELKRAAKGSMQRVVLKQCKETNEVFVEHPLFGMFVLELGDIFADLMRKNRILNNYLEVNLFSPNEEIGSVVCTFQRVEGKTPHQLRQEAENRLKKIVDESNTLFRLANQAWDLSTYAASINWNGGKNTPEFLDDLRTKIETFQAGYDEYLKQYGAQAA